MTILRLDHIRDTRLSAYTDLTNHQLRNALDPTRGIAIVESEIAIRVALAHDVEPLSLLLDERKLRAMDDVVSQLPTDVPVFVLPQDQMEKITGYRVTRGALCAIRRPQPPSVDVLLERSQRIVVLEGITDTSNVGAVFRNAAALGADAVIAAPTCADPLSRRAIRVSMGNVFLVPWTRMEQGQWPDVLFRSLQARHFECLALALGENAVSIDELPRPDGAKRALFFGAEGSGLAEGTIRRCDHKVIIPMTHGVDSLNVAASSAVAMWELFARGEG